MATIRKKDKGEAPAISTASLPDIVFMLLFFFMVSTTMRESTLLVKKPTFPKATELTKLEKKSLVSSIYVAPPAVDIQHIFGTQPVIQLNESIEDVSKIARFVQLEREARSPNDRDYITMNLKADAKIKMGIISDIKMELRKANALKLNYTAVQK